MEKRLNTLRDQLDSLPEWAEQSRRVIMGEILSILNAPTKEI